MFLRNGWYAATWSHELKERPIGRTILMKKLLFFAMSAVNLRRSKIAAATVRRPYRKARSPASI
jgi:hypothetical protein